MACRTFTIARFSSRSDSRWHRGCRCLPEHAYSIWAAASAAGVGCWRRALVARLASHCRFVVQDLAQLQLAERFELILGVTVLQHILDPARLRAALLAIRAHLAPGGRVLLLEAAPTRLTSRCDSDTF